MLQLFSQHHRTSHQRHSLKPNSISTLTQIHFNAKSLIITSCPGDRWLVQCLGCLYSSKGLFYRVVPADQGFHSSDEYAGIFRLSSLLSLLSLLLLVSWGCVCVLFDSPDEVKSEVAQWSKTFSFYFALLSPTVYFKINIWAQKCWLWLEDTSQGGEGMMPLHATCSLRKETSVTVHFWISIEKQGLLYAFEFLLNNKRRLSCVFVFLYMFVFCQLNKHFCTVLSCR